MGGGEAGYSWSSPTWAMWDPVPEIKSKLYESKMESIKFAGLNKVTSLGFGQV